jgi:flagellar basal-body rod protein FlgF
MDSGYYAACAGLRSRAQALELMAGNLANTQTSGYRAENTTFRSILAAKTPASLPALNRAVNDFGVLGNSTLDLAPGNLEQTSGPLDLALEGPGFFAVQAGNGVLYTRNGGFRMSAKGELVTSDGSAVLGQTGPGQQGPMRLPGGQVAIAPDGTITVNGANAGRLQVVEFSRATALHGEGNSLYSAPADAARPATASSVRQGMLESSNVNPVTAAVDLISVQREAEMLQRALSLFNTEFQKIAAQDLPRV